MSVIEIRGFYKCSSFHLPVLCFFDLCIFPARDDVGSCHKSDDSCLCFVKDNVLGG